MNTQAPSARELVALTCFVLACVALTLYLWHAFGGSTPLQAEGYRMNVPFSDAAGLTPQADVRIAGVNVGKVVSKRLSADRKRTIVAIDLDPEWGPRPADTKALLRQKTLLGETYVQLTPGTPGTRMLHDGGTLRAGQVEKIVRLADVLRTFDPETRAALTTWFEGQGEALRGGGPALSATLAQLEPLGRYGADLLKELDAQERSLRSFFSDGATSLQAFTARRGQLRALIVNGERVFRATAARDRDLADTFRAFPRFLRETRLTTNRLGAFATDATPLVRRLQPAAVQLDPVLRDSERLAPDLDRLFTAVGPLARASREGFPALRRTLDATEPLLKRTTPYLGRLIPIFRYFGLYRREFTALFANVAAASQPTLPAADGSGPLHYIRASIPINPEALAGLPYRPSTNRQNAYPAPGSYLDLATTGLTTFTGCTSSPLPGVSSAITGIARTDIEDYFYTSNPLRRSPPDGPPCSTQAPLGPTLTQTPGAYPTLEPLP